MIQKYRTLIIAAVAAVGLVAVGVVASDAAVKPDCKNLMYPLCPRSVAATQVVDNSLPASKIVPADRDAFLKDADSLGKAYYSVAFYDVGNTNAGAIATVACKKTTDSAISGGVQTLVDTASAARNTPVSSSFPGRMNWDTNTPRPDRLDGWIVQFGGNAGATSDKDPLKVKIWALCVPGLAIPVEQTYTQSADN
jgi:hypothetical protein